MPPIYKSANQQINTMSLKQEIQKRRTFGIISHPDAGKTTLTEKLLLFGGAIQEAGAVKSNKIKKGATSDFMEIERQRGISVATSVLAFNYKEHKINILDTPGHKDFAEDTFRTLTAVDSVIVVIDVAKGVEEQTEKLVEVCRMRNIPMIVFINKLDREGKDAFDLLDEVEQKLGLKVTPLSFPIGIGYDFKGIYNIWEKNINLFSGDSRKNIEETIAFNDINSPELEKIISERSAANLRSDLELVYEVYPKFDREAYLNGEQQPVFFGSALNNFGVCELLDCFVEIAPSPRPKASEERIVNPDEPSFTGFVFKIHANMDPNHRDRLAFVKIVSGTFERNKPYLHTRLGKKLHFKGIPSFSPEHFRYINNADPLKSKQLEKGIDQLMDEGVAQLFKLDFNGRKVIGTVGALQYEVIQYRLEHEYGAKCSYENFPIYKACWVEAPKNPKDPEYLDFVRVKQKFLAHDKQNQLVFLADSAFSIEMVKQKYPNLKLHFTSEY